MMAPLLQHLPARPSPAPAPPWDEMFKKDFLFQPKYNGWRGVYDQKTGLAYNRYGKLSSNQRLLDERMARVKIPARYVDLEIMGLRTKTGKETVIVLDAFDPDNPKPIQERIDDFGHIEVAGADIRNGRTYRVWNIWFSGIHKACDIMKHANNQNMGILS